MILSHNSSNNNIINDPNYLIVDIYNKWKILSPFYIKTDGNEKIKNPGGVIFSNLIEGSKIYPIVRTVRISGCIVFQPDAPHGDHLFKKNLTFNEEKYFQWRDSIWDSKRSISSKIYGFNHTKIRIEDDDGKISYINNLIAKKVFQFGEYVRLIRKVDAYKKLLHSYKSGINIVFTESCVPGENRKGAYNKDFDLNGYCYLNCTKIIDLLEDENEPLGFSLCIAYALFQDSKPKLTLYNIFNYNEIDLDQFEKNFGLETDEKLKADHRYLSYRYGRICKFAASKQYLPVNDIKIVNNDCFRAAVDFELRNHKLKDEYPVISTLI